MRAWLHAANSVIPRSEATRNLSLDEVEIPRIARNDRDRYFDRNVLMSSMGSGKMIVEFFSFAISVSVWR